MNQTQHPITRTDAVAKLVIEARKTKPLPPEATAPLRRQSEAVLNLAEAVLQVASGALDAKRVLSVDEGEAKRIARFGITLLDRGEDEAAEAAGLLATTFAPGSFTGWLVFACASARLKKDLQAIIAYQQAIALDPNHLSAWVDIAELYIRRMEFSLASAALTRAMALDPEAKTPFGQRAQVLVVNTLMTLES